MDLILWRHADAEDAYSGISDAERKLTDKGHKQAQKMAAWLNPQLPDKVRIVVSPAIRAVQTAEALKRKFEISDKLFTSAAACDYLEASGWPGADCVLLVGHQPTLGELAALLMSGTPQMWDIKKGAVMWLRSVGDGSEATLRAAMVSGMLK